MTVPFRRIAFVAALLFALGFSRVLRAQTAPVQGWTADKFHALTAHWPAADSDVVLLEGLPHQLVEHSSFLQERKTKRTEEIGGYHFYRAPLPLTPGDAKALRAACLDRRNYQPYGGPKACGGFHPDFALRWGRGREAVYTLICFGCHETESLNGKTCLLADLPEPGFRRFQSLLERYHAQRPAPRRG